METLTDFLDRREREIKDQIKALKDEMQQLKLARGAVTPVGAPTPVRKSSAPTIKELARDILLAAYPSGLSASSILTNMEAAHNRKVERTSLSPQLSRLAKEGHVKLIDTEWFAVQPANNSLEELLGAPHEHEPEDRFPPYDIDFDTEAPF